LADQCADHLVTTDELQTATAAALAEWDALPLGATRSLTPQDTADYAKTMRCRHALVPLLERFAAAKEAAGGVDYGDEMALAARLAARPEVVAGERERYAAVLLDEYQDTGYAQIALLSSLFGGGHPVTAVGDPHQSIYGWRGAAAGSISRYPTTFRAADGARAATFPLATSWRNDARILAVANVIGAALDDMPGAGVQLRARPGAPAGRVRAVVTGIVEE